MLRKIKEVFGIDARALAVFRISLALILITDIFVRSLALAAHYTDAGVLPRGIFVERFANPYWFSIHLFNGSAAFQILLFAAAGIFALMLLFGYKTKIASIVSWIFLISLHSRNPMVLQGGDILLRVLLFWAMFLPLGIRYSIDEALRIRSGEAEKEKNIFSLWTVGILLQAASVFFFSALLKTGNEWFPNGTAIYYALSLDQFATYLGKFLLGFPELIFYMTYFVYFLELIGPILLFIPLFSGKFRTAISFVFLFTIFGMGLSLRLGHFPWISATGFILFLPAWFWDKLGNFFYRRESEKLKVYYDGSCGYCRLSICLIRVFFLLPAKVFLPAQDKKKIFDLMSKRDSWVVIDGKGKKYFYFDAFKPVFSASPLFWFFAPLVSLPFVNELGNKIYKFTAKRRKRSCDLIVRKETKYKAYKSFIIFGNFLAAFFIVYVFLWNVQTLGNDAVPNNAEVIAYVLRIDQMWNMFSPYPLKEDGWYVVDGELSSGKHIDLSRDAEPVTFEKPAHVAELYPHERWRKYLMNLWDRNNVEHRGLYLSYLCRTWNSKHDGDEKLKEINMYFMLELTLPDYRRAEAEKILLYNQKCF